MEALLASVIGCALLAAFIVLVSPLWHLPGYEQRKGRRGPLAG
jgi:hypothetical protein